MSKRYFTDATEAEDFVNDIVFGGDDPTIVGELVEVWASEEDFDIASMTGAWGRLYAVWGTEDEVDRDIESLGEWIDSKGRTGRPDPEEG